MSEVAIVCDVALAVMSEMFSRRAKLTLNAARVDPAVIQHSPFSAFAVAPSARKEDGCKLINS
jgi:hypothetical protein